MRQHFDEQGFTVANHVPLSPVSFLNRAADVYADQPAVVYGPIRRSWAETGARVRSVAAGLQANGIGVGDSVVVLAPNVPEMFELHFAVPMSGGVLVTLNTRLEAETIAYILDHSDCRLVIVDTCLRPLLDEALASLGRKLPVVEIVDTQGPAAEGTGDPDYETLAAHPPLDGDGLPADEGQAIALNYTSGTSGRPKGVIYHHRGAYLMPLGTVAGWSVPSSPAYLSVVPMFHCNGWGHPWMMAIIGAKMVFVRLPQPGRIFEAIAAEKVTHFGAAPVVLQMLAESADAPKTPFDPPLQVMTAGAPPPPAVLERTSALGMEIMHVYGLTETYGHITQCLPQAAWSELDAAGQAEHRSRQGVAFPMVEAVEVIDRATGQPVPGNARGRAPRHRDPVPRHHRVHGGQRPPPTQVGGHRRSGRPRRRAPRGARRPAERKGTPRP